MSQFRKIKHKDGVVTLEWRDESASDTRTTTLSSADEPEPEFRDALAAFVPIVCRLLDLPAEYSEGLRVTGVSISYNDEQGRGIVVTCLKDLGAFNSPLVLNTPHLPEFGEHAATMPQDMVEALDELELRASRYRRGHRLQMDALAA